jgi:hypothetical protein
MDLRGSMVDIVKFEKRPGHAWILQHVNHNGEACLIWPFAFNSAGYGNFMVHKKKQYAHRYMCLLVHGDPPETFQAAHACGNTKCVNPRHLSWKSIGDNQLDRRIHGTNATVRRKLTIEQVRQIRKMKGEKSTVLAVRFGVSEANIRKVQTGVTWSKVA